MRHLYRYLSKLIPLLLVLYSANSIYGQCPVNADFTFSPASPVRGEKVYFNGSLSSDSDGYIVKWEWDFGDGKTATGEKVNHRYTWTGTSSRTFNVVLKVTDNKGGQNATQQPVTISPVSPK